MAETISTSETSSAQPPLSRMARRHRRRQPDCRWPASAQSCSAAAARWCVRASLHRVGDGRAAGGLRSEEAHWLVFDQAEFDQLVECLADLGDQRAASHGDDHVVGQPPAELLGDLKADGLRALGVIGTKIDVHESPVVALGNLRAQPVHVVVVAVDAHQRSRRRPGCSGSWPAPDRTGPGCRSSVRGARPARPRRWPGYRWTSSQRCRSRRSARWPGRPRPRDP